MQPLKLKNAEVKLVEDGIRLGEAREKVDVMGWEDRKANAQGSDPYVLIALSERDLDSNNMVFALLHNSMTPPEALGHIAAMASKAGDDREARTVRNWCLMILKHENANADLVAQMAEHKEWRVRYAVAMHETTPQEVLARLAKDTNVAVAAKAARRLGQPAPDDGLCVGVKCAELNEVFESIKARRAEDGQKVRGLEGAICLPTLAEIDYSVMDEFFRKEEEALTILRDKLAKQYAALVVRKRMPNISPGSGYLDAMTEFKGVVFDAYIIAAELGGLLAKNAEISFEQIRAIAKKLLPYVEDPWGPATKPEQVLDGRRLHLSLTGVYTFSDHASLESEGREQLEAIDKLSKIVLRGASPETVDSDIAEALTYRKNASEFFKKQNTYRIGGSPIAAVRFFKSGRFDVEYNTEEEAAKIARALVEVENHGANAKTD